MNAPNIPDAIVGHEELVALFGHWPTFHDAEVVSIELVRDEGRSLTGPVCTVVVCPIGEPGAPTSEGPLITLRFYDLQDLHLVAFNHQNPILGLEIAGADPFQVTIRGVHEQAFRASFTCSRVEVVSIQPLTLDG